MKTVQKLANNILGCTLYRIIENIDGEKHQLKLISSKAALKIKVFCLWNLIEP